MEEIFSSHRGERLKSYSISFKIEVINYALSHSKLGAAKKYNVDRRRVIDWCKNREYFIEMADTGKMSRKRREGGGRKCSYVDIESELLLWLKERREEGVHVTGEHLKKQALLLHKKNGNQEFKASCGWLRHFQKRNNISLHPKTHVEQYREDAIDIVNAINAKADYFHQYVLTLRQLRNYSLNEIGSMDEISLWINVPGEITLEPVAMAMTGQEKQKLTVILSALADGTKLTPVVVFKDVRTPEQIPDGIFIEVTSNGCSDERITKWWLKKVWKKNLLKRRLLVWDSFRTHLTVPVKEMVDIDYNSDMAVIPGGCLHKLLPCEVSWNKPFKDFFRDAYNDWLANESISLTNSEDCRSPERELLLQWVKKAWNNVTSNVIKRSFLKCGISENMEETEYDFLLENDNSSSDEIDELTQEEVQSVQKPQEHRVKTNLKLDNYDEQCSEVNSAEVD